MVDRAFKNFRRKTALFLAALFVLQAAHFAFPETARAASAFDFSINLNRYLNRLPNSIVPVNEAAPSTSNEMLASWNVARAANDGQFVMRVVMTDDLALYVFVSKQRVDGNINAIVSYGISRTPAAEGALNFNDLVSGLKPDVYSPTSSGTNTRTFIPYDTFVAEQAASSSQFIVRANSISSASPLPTFWLPTVPGGGSGLTTRVNDTEVRFYYDGTTFYVSTNNVKKGFIYDYSLYYNGIKSDTIEDMVSNIENRPAQTIDSRLAMFRGVTAATYEPFANANDEFPRAGFDIDLNHVSSDPDNPAAFEQNGVKMTFDIPKRWAADPLGNKFKAVEAIECTDKSGNTVYKNIGFSVSLTKKFETMEYVSAFVEDMSNGDSTNNIVAYTQYPVTAEYEVNKTTAQGIVYFVGLPAGTIFDAQIRTLIPDLSDFKPVNQNVIWPTGTITNPVNNVYTFLKFTLKGNNIYINPYPYVGSYVVVAGDDKQGGERVSSVDGDGSELPLIVPIDAKNSPRYFTIYFNPEKKIGDDIEDIKKNYIRSQTIYAQPDLNSLGISAPESLAVEYKLDALSKQDTKYNYQSDLTMNLRWNLGYLNDMLNILNKQPNNTLVLNYDLNEILSPAYEPSSEIKYDSVRVTLTLNGADVNAEFRGMGTDVTSTYVIPSRIENMSINSAENMGGTSPMLRANITLKMRAGDVAPYNGSYEAPREDDEGHLLYFFYPGMYFLSVVEQSTGNSSNYQAMTLDPVDMLKIPTSQNLRAINPVTTTNGYLGATKDETSFVAAWNVPARALRQFLEDNYDYLAPVITYSLYISQAESDIKALSPDTLNGRREFLSGVGTVRYIANSDKAVYFSDINGRTGVTVGGISGREYLRNGGTVCVEGISVDLLEYFKYLDEGKTLPGMELKLDGLDKNTRYYLAVDAHLTFTANFEDDNGIKTQEIVTEHSELSNAVAIMTKSDLAVPSPGEAIPGTPVPVWDKGETTSTSLTIHWNRIANLIDNAGNKISENDYEIIRVKERPLSDDLLKMRELSIREFVKNIDATIDRLVLRTDLSDSANPKISQMFSSGEFGVPVSDTLYACRATDSTVWLKDNTLKPNTVYYYYVRTVQSVDGVKTYSPWAGVSATTATVESPKNLTFLRTGVTYDLKTEAYIAFDAPLSSLDQLGVSYNLQYSIKLNNEDWQTPVTMNASLLKASAVKLTGSDEGWYHFVYKLSGLVPGSLYSVQVRMIDMAGDASMYSNIAQTRTDIDQGEYDEQKENSDWTAFIKSELSKLFKDPIWYVQDSSSELTVFYRPSMFGAVIKSATGSELPLKASASNAQKTTYYFPGQVVDEIARSGKALTITNGDMRIIFNKNCFTVTHNDTVIAVKKLVSQAQLAEYMLKLTVSFSPISETIDNNKTVGRQAEITLECVGLTNSAVTWDNQILDLYLSKIADSAFTKEARDEITKMIGDNADNDAMSAYVSSFLAKSRQTLMNDTNSSLNKIMSKSYALNEFGAQYMVWLKNPVANATLRGFVKQSGQWQPASVTDYMDGKAINTKTSGVYAFTGFTANLPGIESVTGNVALSAIIAKYGLDDYLGKGAAFSVDKPASLYTVTGIVARMAGAVKTADPVTYLKDRGYTVSQRNTQDATIQETLYLIMALYEMKTGTKTDTVKITNYSKTSAIKGIDARYLKSVQAAYELSLYDNPAMKPTSPVTVKELLDIITALNKKIKL